MSDRRRPTLETVELLPLNILRDVDLDSVWDILEHCPVLEIDEGEQLLSVGEQNERMYMIIVRRVAAMAARLRDGRTC